MTVLLQIMEWIHTYQREIFVGAFLGVQVIVFIALMVVSHKLTKTRKLLQGMPEQIVKQIENSLKYAGEQKTDQKADQLTEKHIVNLKENHRKDEEENRVISSVLKEIFP